ncbi:2Fe-2S iron-sulfur cluster-binding protein [Halalkalirubrum salinum]|uniref:2Fe-2S iron-sulfur cluster-binding protein n=1 Tax=Halalkalirubrum salinum TaxID=2563889 RepID=UPI0010FB7CE9|nr:2Fe-2S iron-sulfur cluster-binding protein [Halalkalirubrum salinum]
MPHAVTLEWRDGRSATVDVREDETVIEAIERAGLGVPYGCLYGACATCTARLLEGDLVHVKRPRGLKPQHSLDGYVLLCVAEPRSDCRIEVGAVIQADLVQNPWK